VFDFDVGGNSGAHRMDEEQESIWCLIANVIRAPHLEEDGELRLGTKRFAPGAKLFCFPPEWGDGGERLRVLGQHRGGSRLVEAVVATKFLTNWRTKQVFHPFVVQAMKDRWDDSDASRERAEELVAAFRRREDGTGAPD
jgi:hypothetical protein